MSQISPCRMSDDVAAALKAFGPQFNPDILKATWQLFAPLADADGAGSDVDADIAYGSEARQRLDVYRPKRARAPILIYVPGGGFVGGSKSGYGHLGRFFAAAGFLTIIADYRLAPADGWPAGATDVASVIDWAAANGGDYGADTGRVHVFGQSAGATHVASAILDLKLRAKSHDRIRAVALMSGIYCIGSSNLTPSIVQYFGSDPSQYWLRAPLAHASNSSPPTLLMSAQFDPFGLGATTLDLAKALYLRDGINPPHIWMNGHNHISGVACIGTSMDDVGPVILDFFGKVAG